MNNCPGSPRSRMYYIRCSLVYSALLQNDENVHTTILH